MNIFKKWERSIYKRLLRRGLMPPKVIVLLDGGICSQMHQYLLGQLYHRRGYRVAYDLSFFDEWGMDINLEYVRNFDLLKAFPYLKLKKAHELAVVLYKKNYYYVGNNTSERINDFSFLEKKPPVYLGGYYHLPASIWLDAFRSLFRIDSAVLDESSMQISNEIESRSCSIGVHVRRGDLKVERFDYGRPATIDYFLQSACYFKEKMSSPFFYFFSDEPEWVENVLVPQLNLEPDSFKVVNINSSDRGYMDLFLMARCKHQITSKGTMGKYAALLMDNPDKITILCDDEIEYSWKELLTNPIFL